MIEDESPGPDSQSRGRGAPGESQDAQGERITESEAGRARSGLRLVQQADTEQSAVQLAASLTEAVARFLLDAERLATSRAERIRAAALEDLERQRTNVNSLISMFAERLRQQEEGLVSQRQAVLHLGDRLGRHAEALHALREAQEQTLALLSESLAVLRLLGATAGGRAGEEGAEG